MARTDSIHDLSMKAVRGIRASLKTRGITVPDVEGPSDEPHLRSLQELQAIHGALQASDQAAASGTLTLTDISDSGVGPVSLPGPKGSK